VPWLRNEPLGIWTLLLILGAVLGSFVNVVIHRLPRGVSLIRPASHCPHCGKQIRPYDNVPVLSYLWLRGRCRECRQPIPVCYLIVEVLGAILTLLAVGLASSAWEAIVSTALALALLAVFFIDLEFGIIPDVITLPGAILGLLWALMAFGATSLPDALLGVLVGGGGLLLIAGTYRLLTGREGLGMGDVKLMAMLGAFLGWQGVLATLIIGALAGSIVGLGLILTGRGTRKTPLPFGTFLVPAAWLVLFAGRALWTQYVRLSW
jgi:leader peptidase (prepilin peptidase)/N-methyltransferase